MVAANSLGSSSTADASQTATGSGGQAGRSRRLIWVLAPAVGLMITAIVLRFGIGPALERLPADYGSEIVLEATTRFRETPGAEAKELHQRGRRVDQVMSVTNDVAVIQSHVDWSDESGQVNYQTTGLYGVDRRTRGNVAGYGDLARNGQFLFPPHLSGTLDQVWDPYYSGPRRLTFERNEAVGGLTLAVYRFDVAGLDETKAYDFLPDVPERFGASTNGEGRLWIEPVSGILVDLEDNGHTFFAEPAKGRSAGDINAWQARYSAASKDTLLRLASTMRLQILATEIWLPLALLALAFTWLAIGLVRLRRRASSVAP